MATFQVRVEDRVGSIGDTAALTDWLTANGRYLTRSQNIGSIVTFAIA